MASDSFYMRIALEEAAASSDNKGKVGAAIVHNDRLVCSAGSNVLTGKHAEQNAIEKAGWLGETSKKVRSVIYVTIQPCTARGEFIDCCNLIASAGIASVVYAGEDPQIGRKLTEQRLRELGVDVRQIADPKLIYECRKVFDESFDELVYGRELEK